MQRVWAILLVCLFSFTLIGPAVSTPAGSELKLPACCRKNGQHHCSAMNPVEPQTSGAAIRTVRVTCPSFPKAEVVPAYGKTGMPTPSGPVFAVIVSHPTAHAQIEAQYRVSFSRAWQKRGPPALLA